MSRPRSLIRQALRTTATTGRRVIGDDRIAHRSTRVVLRTDTLRPADGAEIVGNYIRGWMYYGTPGALLADHRWEIFPERAVVTAETAHIPKSLRPVIRKSDLEIRFDQDFEAIIESTREGREIPWITDEVIDQYRVLHRQGVVATMGAYREGRLVAGLWGLEVGRTFGILSQFHAVPDSGNLMQVAYLSQLGADRRWDAVDLGHLTEGFRQFGARALPLDEFCDVVLRGLAQHGPRVESLKVNELLPVPVTSR